MVGIPYAPLSGGHDNNPSPADGDDIRITTMDFTSFTATLFATMLGYAYTVAQLSL